MERHSHPLREISGHLPRIISTQWQSSAGSGLDSESRLTAFGGSRRSR